MRSSGDFSQRSSIWPGERSPWREVTVKNACILSTYQVVDVTYLTFSWLDTRKGISHTGNAPDYGTDV